jgi:hypothetical protein
MPFTRAAPQMMMVLVSNDGGINADIVNDTAGTGLLVGVQVQTHLHLEVVRDVCDLLFQFFISPIRLGGKPIRIA